MRAHLLVVVALGACGRIGFGLEPPGDAVASGPTCRVARYTASHLPVGLSPRALTVGDFDRDGHLDLAVTNGDATDVTAQSISILLGRGDGTFAPHVDYPTGLHPWSIAAGDLDGDGALDLVVGNYDSAMIGVYYGLGDGTFAVAAMYATDAGPQSVAIGDVDGDGLLDVVVAAHDADLIDVLYGGSGRAFRTVMAYPVATGSSPYQAVIGDLDRDGTPDLVVADALGGAISVLRGRGGGTFAPHTEISTGATTEPYSIALGDLDGDGRLDAVVANNFSTATLGVMLGNGDGTFAPPLDQPVGPQPWWISIADVTGDGIPDLVTCDGQDSVAGILPGNGDATFRLEATYATDIRPLELALGDFDHNGGLDIALATQTSSEVTVLSAVCQ